MGAGRLAPLHQPLPFLKRHILQRPALLLPGEQEHVPGEGRMMVPHALEVELDTAGNQPSGNAQHGFSLLIEKIVGLCGDLGDAQERFADMGVVILVQLRQKLQADAVAGVIYEAIAGIVSIFLSDRLQVFENFGARDVEERADDCGCLGQSPQAGYAGESREAGAGEDVEYYGFGLIVRRVGSGQITSATLGSGGGKEIVARLSSRSLDSFAAATCRQIARGGTRDQL